MATDLMDAVTEQQLAILGGPKVITQHEKYLFHWPIVTEEDEQAVIAVLRDGSMSGVGITKLFEQEFAAWQGVKHALAYPNGTMALMTAMWALGVRRGDEIIAPSMTYWASATPVLGLGGIPVFADVDPKTLCLDPADIERHISKRTKLIVPVHYAGHPCDMDAIMAIAKKHNLKVLEDVSHSHGALYKGRMVGTFGHAAAMSMMAGKSFAIGEGGMLVTNDRAVYERAALFANYERHTEIVTDPELKPLIGIPWGGMKGRLNQTAAAMGRVQLKHYPARIREIQAGMNRFWDLLEGVPGLRAHRPAKNSGSTMGGWYAPHGLYVAKELGGLPIKKFCEAVTAEGVGCTPGANFPMHSHPLFNSIDVYGDGKPTIVAQATRDTRQAPPALAGANAVGVESYSIPWFKHDRPELIERYAAAFRKVAIQASKLR